MPASLWRNADFMRLWVGQTVSKLGSSLTGTALPLAAVLNLGAGPAQMGLLSALGAAPVLLIGLFAGAWADRTRKRPLMIVADLGRVLVLGSIPLAAALGMLRLEHIYIVALLTGLLTVFFDVSYPSYLPGLVGRGALLKANSMLGVSSAVVEITGPGLAGILVEVVSAPFAILFDAVSFLFSALSLGSIRAAEAKVEEETGDRSRKRLIQESLDGLKLVIRKPVLRAITGASGTLHFFGNFIGALYSLYAVQTLGLSPALLGLTIGVGGIGELVGSSFSVKIVQRFGVGKALIWSALTSSLLALTIPLARGPQLAAAAILMVGQLLQDTAFAVFFINELSMRQAYAPPEMLGRVNASNHVLVAGIAPLGALLGGGLGVWIGLRPTLVIAAFGMALSAGWLIFSPVRGMRN